MTTKRNLAPTAKYLLQPAYDAILALGGSGTVGEILDRIIADGNYSKEEISEPHRNETKMKYNLRWALHDLEGKGVIQPTKKTHIWTVTKKYAKRIPLPFNLPKESFTDHSTVSLKRPKVHRST